MVGENSEQKPPDGYGSKHVAVGKVVDFYDPCGKRHDALITAVWSSDAPFQYPNCSVNLVYVSANENEEDTYGRQIDREGTSVPNVAQQSAHGYYWAEKK